MSEERGKLGEQGLRAARERERLPRWQQILLQHPAWRHYTTEGDPPPAVHFHENRVEVDGGPTGVAARLYTIASVSLEPNGYRLVRQPVPANATRVTIHIEE